MGRVARQKHAARAITVRQTHVVPVEREPFRATDQRRPFADRTSHESRDGFDGRIARERPVSSLSKAASCDHARSPGLAVDRSRRMSPTTTERS